MNRYKIITSLLIFGAITINYAKQPSRTGGTPQLSGETIVVDESVSFYDGRSYLIIKELTLTPGFHVSAADDGDFYAKMYVTSDNVPPSSDQNYVRTETAREGTTDEYTFSGWEVDKKSTDYQYVDGLGRELQSISVQASPGMQDVVQVIAYDGFGRQPKAYLPFTLANSKKGKFVDSGNNGITEQANFFNTATNIDLDGAPYSFSEFEPSPLNRVVEQFGPGADWFNNSKSTKPLQKVNVSSEVRYWDIVSGKPVSSTYYASQTLLVSKVTDEEGNQVVEYTDSRGLVVQKKVLESAGNWLKTNYIYDELGNLRFVLPPEAASTYIPTQVFLDDYAFAYTYDNQQRLIEKKLPGADPLYLVYDRWDRLVLTQDGNQRLINQWSFTKYDEYNRATSTGFYSHSGSHTTLITAVQNSTVRFDSGASYSFPSSNAFAISYTYYDNYNFMNNANWGSLGGNYIFAPPTGFNITKMSNVKGQITGGSSLFNGDAWLDHVVYYDDDFQVIQAVAENHIGGTDRVSTEYDFVGNATKTKYVHNSSIAGVNASLEVLEEYTYDHADRLMDTYHTIGTGARLLMTSNTYNELGELIEKNVHDRGGNDFLQSIDYRYNIRGWLTSINNSTLNNDGTKNNDNTDLFGMELLYNDAAVAVNGANTTPFYDGNIAAIKWNTNNHTDAIQEKIYRFGYDGVSRLISASYAENNGSGTYSAKANYFDVNSVNYDDNGNIENLSRNGVWGANAPVGIPIDNLTYVYKGNQLKSVADTGNESGFNNGVNMTTEYTYDANGNLTKDYNKSIVNIDYNHLNLPTLVEFDQRGSIEYLYDAGGLKLRKIVKDGNGTELSRTDYVGGIQYENSTLSFLSTSEGRAVKTATGYDYEYFHTDHLGNTRMVYGYLNEVVVYQATMETSQDVEESEDFDNISVTNRSTIHNHTLPSVNEPNPNESILTNGSGNATGPVTMFDVSAGDKINMEVFARYDVGGSNADVLVDVATSLINAIESTSTIVETAQSAINSSLPGISGAIPNGAAGVKAYLNYMIFDKSHVNAPVSGYVPISSSAAVAFEQLAREITISSDGFIYIYVANESDYNVYWDDFTVVHEKNNKALQVTQSNDYYPFGLTYNSWELDKDKGNKHLYQGAYSQKDEDTEWNSFDLRNYDPQLGRWTTTDPADQFSSPYLGMGNSPITQVDPDGAFTLAGAFLRNGLSFRGLYKSGGEWGFNRGTGQMSTVSFTRNGVAESIVTEGSEFYVGNYGEAFKNNTSVGRAQNTLTFAQAQNMPKATGAVTPVQIEFEIALLFASAGILNAAKAGATTAKGSTSAARLSSNGANLNKHLTQLEKYGSGGYKTLQNGRLRYYGKATLNRGDANSFRMVREWNPATGGKRTWFETLNPNGGVIQVRPELGTGVDKIHYIFNGSGKYLRKW